MPNLSQLTRTPWRIALLTVAAAAVVFTAAIASHANADSHLAFFRVWRIEPSSTEVTAFSGERVQLRLDVYDKSGGSMNSEVDQAVHDDIIFRWIGIGEFSEPRNIQQARKSGRPDDRIVEYRVPYGLGTYTVVASLRTPDICATERTAGCTGRSTAAFTIKVINRTTYNQDTAPEPKDPEGLIPSQITDDSGNLYSVALPTTGGNNADGNATISIPIGAVNNETYVGIRISKLENIPAIERDDRQRVTLSNDWYQVDVVNARGEPLLAYRLNKPAAVCLPMPVEFSPYLTDITLVEGLNASRLLTSNGNYDAEYGWRTCGNTSSLPGTFTVAVRGDRPELIPEPTATPVPIVTISVGGSAPSPNASISAAMLGALVVLLGLALIATAKHRRNSNRSKRQPNT